MTCLIYLFQCPDAKRLGEITTTPIQIAIPYGTPVVSCSLTNQSGRPQLAGKTKRRKTINANERTPPIIATEKNKEGSPPKPNQTAEAASILISPAPIKFNENANTPTARISAPALVFDKILIAGQ